MNTESYAHKYAKIVLAEWFREKIRYNQENGYNNSYYIFNWEPNTTSGLLSGVFLEYPILSRQITAGTEILGVKPIWTVYPNMELAQKNGRKIEAVLDIAVCDNDTIKYGFEIVYKHKTPPSKIAFLKTLTEKYGVKVYEIDALWILNQVHRPSNLKIDNHLCE